MAFTAKQHKVIGWISKRDGLKPQLSAYPDVYFLDAKGNEVQHNIRTLIDWYDQE